MRRAIQSRPQGFCRKNHQSLQKYEKTEGHMLVCTDCQPPLVRNSRSQEHCARKCKKVKKNFNCRAFNFQRHNRKCHLLPFDRFTHGAQKQANVNFTLYEKKGYCAVTKSGCFTHEGPGIWFYPDRYPTQDLRENFCRNPNNDPGGPWCYTTDPNVRAEECGIPQCSEDVCVTCNGGDYRGKMDHTESGKECQRWDSSRPHKHHFQPKKYRDKDLKDNYCRNPDNRLRPWCYTLDPKTQWEYCNITVCDSDSGEDTDVNVTTSCVQGKGTDYRGTMNVTPEGVTCQRWDSQFPHNHSFLPQNFKCKDLRENYCRNPDGADYPWCFTTDPNRRIANCTHIPSGDSHSTESHVGLVRNYCRNPDRDKHGPWCYTNPNNRLVWDYCKLKHCLTRPKISCFVHINTRIVGGHEVRGTDGSWVVSIQRDVPDLKDYSVQVGLRHLNESSKHPRLRISRLICGPEGSNLVMLKLADPAPVSEGASTIHLPVKECHILEGTNCTMYGWGETKNTGHDETLNAVTMPMVNNDMCAQIKGDAGESRICAGGKRGKGVCDKDYGGPLVCQEHERKVIVGVSIQRTKCASSQPALFVNVAFYTEWIYKVFKLYPSLERN
ncbi:Hepatocyte growth factor Hepatopoietin-A [Collichthys lucidus]|uniref:Hepatocyte growth factor Hepatopoietin-A n=1 Tax=Collichthys lucidus TaxID=240159 RepID=A0A4U5VRG1_COLLU|nr:Hepatocyte growth factor Hepatopoietin-A [Collichthys lucidus]